jgi:hypothetical protein
MIGMPYHLLYNILQIFTLSHFYALVFIAIVLLDGGRIGAAFINVDQARLPIETDSFVQKSQCCLSRDRKRQDPAGYPTKIGDLLVESRKIFRPHQSGGHLEDTI